MLHLRAAVRHLAKSPGFTAVAVLSLALGIGANTTVFSLVNEVMLKRLPVRAPATLTLLEWSAPSDVSPRSTEGWSQTDPATGEQVCSSFPLATFQQLREHATTLTDLVAFAPLWRVNVVQDGQAESVTGAAVVSGNYHAMLGVNAIAGRVLTLADDVAGAPPVVVISHAYWQSHFGGSPAAINAVLRINGANVTVVGVTPPGFTGTMQVGETQDLTLPVSCYALLEPGNPDVFEPWCWWLNLLGRRRADVTREQVTAELTNLFRASLPTTFAGEPAAGGDATAATTTAAKLDRVRLRVTDGATGLNDARRDYVASLRMLSAITGLVLLVACMNLANLLLARGANRQRELAVRLALGAGRARLIAQLLTESLLLATFGAAAGLLLAVWSRDALIALQPLGRGVGLTLPLDWRVLGFTAATAVMTGVVFGLVPAWRCTGLNPAADFGGGARTLGGGRSRFAQALMALQVALSLVLLIGAGLFARTLANLQRTDFGFDGSQLLLFSVDAVSTGHAPRDLEAFYRQINERLRADPAVTAAAYARVALLAGGRWTSNYAIEDPLGGSPQQSEFVVTNGVSPEFFDTLHMPLLRGRGFTAEDRREAPKVVIVNETFARKYLAGTDPLGRRLGFADGRSGLEFTVIGIVRDAKYVGLRDEPQPALFMPHAQIGNPRAGNFAVRFHGPAATLVPRLTAAVRALDPNLPLYHVRTQEQQLERSLAGERLFARLATVFGALALALAGIGLYGLLAYMVARRTGEIGLRMALGALPAHVRWMILRESLLIVGVGTATGLAAAAAVSRLIASQLFGLSPVDPVVYAVAGLTLVAVAIVASLLPARHALRIDPMVALRTD